MSEMDYAVRTPSLTRPGLKPTTSGSWQYLCIWFKYDLGQKYYSPQVRCEWDSNSWLADPDSTFHVTETPALTTRPSVTAPVMLVNNCLSHQGHLLCIDEQFYEETQYGTARYLQTTLKFAPKPSRHHVRVRTDGVFLEFPSLASEGLLAGRERDHLPAFAWNMT